MDIVSHSLFLNSTHVYLGISGKSESWKLWDEIFNKGQLLICAIGFWANLATVLTRRLNGQAFSIAIRILFQVQAILDAIVCGLMFLMMVQPPFWLTGYYYVDEIICHVYHSSYLFYCFLNCSIWNIVYLAFERYYGICCPFQHKNLTKTKLKWTIIILGLILFVISFPNLFRTDLVGITCSSSSFDIQLIYDLLYAFSFFVFFIFYIIPSILIVVFYGKVIQTF